VHLKQIEISGFKSFAAPTVLSFEMSDKKNAKKGVHGMTAVVGPNGSGKSNVSDALRWVMGEQSMKNLRGKKSEDVIFAGSATKSKQSMARVALVFDNRDKKIPIEYEEVVIERKMFRSGDSEYLINGARVRLLDVVDLLAQAGMGKSSHCVVGQGMTDAILGATPAERRLMIEDAAGVKHFQLRKIRSEKKLDKTRDNLTRTRELISEVEPRLKILKRQADQAAKSKVVYDELKSLQRVYFACLWNSFHDKHVQLDKKQADAEKALSNAEQIVDKLTAQISAEAKKVENANVVSSFEDEKNSFYAELRKIDQEIASAKGQVEIQNERKIQEQKIKSVPVDLSYVRKQLDNANTQSEKIEKTLTEMAESEVEVHFPKIRKMVIELRESIAKLHSDAGRKTVQLPQNIDDQKIKKIDIAIEEAQSTVKNGESQREEVQKGIDLIDKKIAEGLREDREARTQFFVLEKDHREKQRSLDSAKDVTNSIKIELAKLEVHEEDVAAQTAHALGVDVKSLSFDANDATYDINLEQSELRINGLQAEYERIGAIDPLVVEEYEETRERYEFLTTECSDLEKAISSLRDIITEMDKKIHEAFVKAYKDINEEFTKYFRILFNGGNAKLKKIDVELGGKKTDTDDEEIDTEKKKHKTEIGIEILASPPGKKISQLSLLSGGERSLTSIAMLFAIIAYNPPPFAVLDEVEAALDEANSRRLAKIFAELSTQTQFVIITHNRETMRHADMLYGVTMAKDGASQILSVKIDQLTDKDTTA